MEDKNIPQGDAALKPPAPELLLPSPKFRRTLVLWTILTALVLLFVIIIVFGKPGQAVKPEYQRVYSLVSDKISASAPIEIYLPKGLSKNDVEAKIKFEPALKGEWADAGAPDAVLFKPAKKLEVGKYYTATLSTPSGEISKDFMADEDPAIIQVFPEAGVEADEGSPITISFNRPMVPLTTLSELDKKAVPVTITPETAGKFKWISTRTLQFIPDTALHGSATYTVNIGAMTSMDGLSTAKKTYSFTTRRLRLDGTTQGTIVYKEPFEFRFNQPVDLDATKAQVAVSRTNGKSVPISVSYGTRPVFDQRIGKTVSLTDRSIIRIVPLSDQFGRSGFWDFGQSYSVSLNQAYPLGGGDLLLPAKITAVINTTGIMDQVVVKSNRTDLASQSLFDPEGTTTLTFYEDIDLNRSVIQAPGLKAISYGEKCEDSGKESYGRCRLVTDKKTLNLIFDAHQFEPGEHFSVRLIKLFNTDGVVLGPEETDVPLTVYPKLTIYKTSPADGASGADLTKLYVCTNSPLEPKTGAAFQAAVKADGYLVPGRWQKAYRRENNQYYSDPCSSGQYVNLIRYGLLPERQYALSLNLEDVFGQTVVDELKFTTGAAPKFYLQFQSLQPQYNVTTPDKTKLTFATENFDTVYVHICEVEPGTMVRYLSNRPKNSTSGQSLDCASSKEDAIAMPPNLWVNNYFQLDLSKYYADPRGQYIISFSNPNYVDNRGQLIYERTYLSVTNLAVAEKRVLWTRYDSLPDLTRGLVNATDSKGELYWVSRIGTLDPVSNAAVTVYHNPGYAGAAPSAALSGVTDAQGLAALPLVQDVVGATIQSGNDAAVLSSWSDTLNWSSSAWAGNRIYMYTDRPIYRPGQKVNLKGLYRLGFDGVFEINDQPIELKIVDARGAAILDKNLPVNKFGTFNTSFDLPKDAPLGYYSVQAGGQYASFRVEEYQAAAFEATVKSDKDEYLAGGEAKLSIAGKYYFGVPVSNATVNYSLTAQDYYFDRYTDEYFNFGAGWYTCFDCGYGDSYIKSGEAKLDANGQLNIAELLDFNDFFQPDYRNRSKIIVFHATITDSEGRAVSAESSFIVHRGEYYIGVKADPSYAGLNQPFDLRLKTVDTSGKPVRESGLTVVVNKVEWKSYKRQEVDGNYYNRYERTLTPVLAKTVGTDSKGDYKESFKLSDAGEYEIDVSGTDSRRNPIVSQASIYIFGKGSVRSTNNATLDIQAEKTNLKIGETARIIFQSPYNAAKALIAVERGRLFDYKIVDVNQNVFGYSFPVTEDYVPNVYASVLLLSPDPEVKFGQVQFNINQDSKRLKVEVTTDKKAYLPGEPVKLHISTTDASGKPVPADVSVSVADLSVLALAGNQKKDPVVFFYSGLPLAVTTSANIKNILEEVPIPTGTKGGGGSSAEDLAKRQRGDFRDTAFWQADVVTNASGVADVSFKLPDNLTSWQIESLGITADTKLGVNYSEITAKKNLMVTPIAPRFVLPGDEFEIGAKVFNQSPVSETFDVSIQSSTLVSESKNTRKVSIDAGQSLTLYFKVKAPGSQNSGGHDFVLEAKSRDYEDSVKNTIPVRQNLTYEAVATGNSTSANTASEYIFLPEGVRSDQGGLSIKTSATLAVFLSDALKYLVQYPYGCTEQLSSTLSSIAKLKRALAIPNVAEKFNLPKVSFGGQDYTADDVVSIGLSKIYDSQNSDGGFSYFQSQYYAKSDLFLSVSVLNALLDIKAAGYPVNQNVINSVAKYVSSQAKSRLQYANSMDFIVSVQYALARAGMPNDSLTNYILANTNSAFLVDKGSSQTLAYLALLSEAAGYGQVFTDKVLAAMENRVDIDSRGAYLKTSSSDINWQYYETPVKNTALLLKVLSITQKDYGETANLLRWLLASRSSDGAWGSTQNTAAVLDAFTDYLKWKKETQSDFALSVSLDGREIQKYDFNKNTILSIYDKFLPISTFRPNTVEKLSFTKTNRNNLQNNFYYDLSLKYYLPADQIAPRDEGITIERNLYSLSDDSEKQPLSEVKVGEVVKGRLTIVSGKPRHNVAVEDFIPAGFELVNFTLATEDQTNLMNKYRKEGALGDSAQAGVAIKSEQRGFWDFVFNPWRTLAAAPLGVRYFDEYDQKLALRELYPDYTEMRDDRLFIWKEDLPAGQYTYEYYLRATTPGSFSYPPAVASEMYNPENFGRTGGSIFQIFE